jgi:hypothetical protein
MEMKHMKFKRLIVFLITVAVVIFTLSGCGPGHNYNQSALYYAPIREFLISKNLCANERDCIAKDLIFFEGGIFEKSPININIYHIKDIEAAYSILEIVKKQRRLSTVGINITIYRTTHLERPSKILLQETIN